MRRDKLLQRYELEIPETVLKCAKPKELEFTSRRDGYQRFHTAKIKQLVDRLEEAEARKEQAITPFICNIFVRLHSLHLVWTQLIRCLAELDCLAALAVVSGLVRVA